MSRFDQPDAALNRYRSFKRVSAAVITGYDVEEHWVSLKHSVPGQGDLHVEVPADFFARGVPQPGDYFVRYDREPGDPDDKPLYVSRAPRASFENNHKKLDDPR